MKVYLGFNEVKPINYQKEGLIIYRDSKVEMIRKLRIGFP